MWTASLPGIIFKDLKRIIVYLKNAKIILNQNFPDCKLMVKTPVPLDLYS